GQVNSLIDDLRIIAKHSQLLTDDPLLLSSMICVAMDASCIDTVERVCAHVVLDSQRLIKITELLELLENKNYLFSGMIGDRSMFNDAIEYAMTFHSINSPIVHIKYKLPGMRGLLLHDKAYALEIYNRYVHATENPIERLPEALKIKKDLENKPSYYPFSQILSSGFSRAFELQVKHTGQVRCARAALACERYRLANKKFPEKLYQLVPDYLDKVPLDPFDDKPLRYRMDEDAIIVYSVGEDGIDNGGDVEHRTTKECPSDWGFVLLKPAYRNLPPEQKAPTTQSTPPQTIPN
ncbi:MAG: hypothetical protein ACYTF1_26540, partial [Planctomycetota bacterium]